MYQVEVGPEFVKLGKGDVLQAGDQRYVGFSWLPVPKSRIGEALMRLHYVYRRPKADAAPEGGTIPKTYMGPPVSSETPGDQEPKKAPVDPGEGYRLLDDSEIVAEGDQYLDAHEHSWTGFEPWDAEEYALRVNDPDWTSHVFRRKVPSILQQDFQATEDKIHGTLESLGLLHLLPRPFTPSKYTRMLRTLDGRTVPVDVYAVSGAFGIRSVIENEEAAESVLHSRKKLLAPGMRGHKTAIQDLKEAYQSLGRAIEVLEGK